MDGEAIYDSPNNKYTTIPNTGSTKIKIVQANLYDGLISLFTIHNTNNILKISAVIVTGAERLLIPHEISNNHITCSNTANTNTKKRLEIKSISFFMLFCFLNRCSKKASGNYQRLLLHINYIYVF